MKDIVFIIPTEEHKSAVLEYRQEFIEHDEILHGSGGLEKLDTFEEWLQKIRNDKNPATVPEGRVPATEFIAVRKSDNKVVGMIQIRHELNDFLLTHGGHIGYSVRKSERRKGYATHMLAMAIEYCQSELHLDKVLLTCDKGNDGSATVIQTCGGVFENETTMDDGTITQRYWITIN